MEERAEGREQTEDEQKENNKKNQKEMKELLNAIRKSKNDNAQLMYIMYTDINGKLKVGFENVIAGLADDVHELAENNN